MPKAAAMHLSFRMHSCWRTGLISCHHSRAVNPAPVQLAGLSAAETRGSALVRGFSLNSEWLLFIAAGRIPVRLLWDFSWESTVGVNA
jgi:hypothetical protein